ncbi:polyprenyl synthetase family protein [Nocardia sp. NPDC051750]|uniref:polyprenyl synthetase family protein n=1 Tax=Nocardia sp. NPDC051750 TaxID=3364325 RepID=UPI00379F7835
MDADIAELTRSRPGPPRTTRAEQVVPEWHDRLRARVLAELDEFLKGQHLDVAGIAVDQVLWQYTGRGKCVRPAFMYSGWLCGAEDDAAALRASAATELLHAFALLQDDVMDEAAVRRGEPAAHVRLADQHRGRGAPGCARRFGESAATLLGDLCLVWSEQMLRDSGVPAPALSRVWPHYDRMRIELALGQFADLGNDIRTLPSLESVLAIARAKSGDYTVKWPLIMGASMAGCGEQVCAGLAEYGRLIGEAFQLRDDVLGVYGLPEVTGKPGDTDIAAHKATTLLVAAVEMAGPRLRGELRSLLEAPALDESAVRRVRSLITATGAPARIESMISERVTAARRVITDAPLPAQQRTVLDGLATRCTTRRF